MAVDILDDHDGRVHQQAEGQDQGKKSYAVDGGAKQVVRAQGQPQSQGHAQAHDQRFFQAEKEDHHQEHREHRDAQMLEQHIHGGIGLLAVVAGDDEFHPGGDELLFHPLNAREHLVGDNHRIGAGFLGDRQGDRRNFRIQALAETRVRGAEGKAR